MSDVWIRFGALVLVGVTIDVRAVIRMAATVSLDLPLYGVVVGNPARYRFRQDVIYGLLASRCRSNDDKLMRVAASESTNPRGLLRIRGNS